jgi:hypothetical protein
MLFSCILSSVQYRRFCADPLYVIVDVRLGVEGIPTTAYRTAEEVEVRTLNSQYIEALIT